MRGWEASRSFSAQVSPATVWGGRRALQDTWAPCSLAVTDLSCPCFLSDPWEGLLELDSGRKRGSDGQVSFTEFSSSIMKGSKGMEAETAAKAMEECHLLASPQGLLSLLFYITQDHLPRGSTVQSRLGSPYQSLINEMSHSCHRTAVSLSPLLARGPRDPVGRIGRDMLV